MSEHPEFLRPLEGMFVGITLSESTDSHDLGFSVHEVNRLAIRLAETLLGEGACLVFGHKWRRDGVMSATYRWAIHYQSARGGPSILNYLPWPDEPGLTKEEVKQAAGLLEIHKMGLPPDLAGREADPQFPVDPYLRARALTHVRRQIVAKVDAQICFGGRTKGSTGRFPGVVEEVYLLTEAGKPVYLSGLIGGATRKIIEGLRTRKPNEELFSTDPRVEEAYKKRETPDCDPDARIDRDVLRRHFADKLDEASLSRANRLDLEENRRLCDASTTTEAIGLIVQGLRRICRAKPSPPRAVPDGDAQCTESASVVVRDEGKREIHPSDDATLARQVVREGLAGLAGGTDLVKGRIGKLSVLSEEEFAGLEAFQARIQAYSELKAPEHPLCLGVFGPPGSGKSFAVRQILDSMRLAPRLVNLSQLEGPGDLSSALSEIARWSRGEMPVVFFDEFDSQLSGTPLGWLQWLLGPMQDGIVAHHGIAIEMKRAVFVFAGGTSDSFEAFPAAHAGYFRAAKGPDFVSRLRGHVNVRGVNDWPSRRLRRATVLRLAIERSAPGLLDAGKKIRETTMTDEFIDRILSVGRFVHGARSIEALVEMSTRPTSTNWGPKDLPATEVLDSHVDYGPLGKLVIALSAGGGEPVGKGEAAPDLDAAWTRVATRLLELGAGLVYGGDLRRGGFTERLDRASSRLPTPLRDTGRPREANFARPRPARVTWIGDPHEIATDRSVSERVDVIPFTRLSDEELADLDHPTSTIAPDLHRWLVQALEVFRKRALLARSSDAHLVFGGKMSGFSGRFRGIAEELMLSLAAGSAVYVCGGFGGAAREVGQWLGLGDPWSTVPTLSRDNRLLPGGEALEGAVMMWRRHFQLPRSDDLPVDFEGLVRFLRTHAVDGPRWPGNGLTAEENRYLFRSTIRKKSSDSW